MSGRWLRAATTMLVATAVGVPAITVLASADDKQRLDAAMEAFDERMTEAGWVSQGSPDEDAEEDGADEMSAGDDAFAECLGETTALFEISDVDEFPGQVAASSSDEFSYAPSADAASTTEAFTLDLTEETVAAFAASVDDANIATVTEFIEVIGAKETGDCMRAAFEAEMALEPDDSAVPVEFDITVTNEGDLGIGDQSAALGYELTAVFIMPIEIKLDVVFSQVGSDVVGLVRTVSGEPTSGFDPLVELQAIVDSLAA